MVQDYGSTDFEIEKLISNVSDGTSSYSHCDDDDNKNNKASVGQTSMNMIKMCIGTGCLALPYAVNEGGSLWFLLGMAIVTLWNIYSTDRLLKCHKYMKEYNNHNHTMIDTPYVDESVVGGVEDYDTMKHSKRVKETTSTFGQVTYFAFGNLGLQFIDAMMMTLMFGIIVAYEDAILGFIADTPFTMGSKIYDALGMLLIIIPLASMSDFSLIARVSAIGTSIIFSIFLLIGYYGIEENGLRGFSSISEQHLWPKTFSSFSSWYGVVAFGLGTVPFTFNLQESMHDPSQMMKATKISLWIVYITYVVSAELLSIIFWPTIHGFQSDVISALPYNSLLSRTIKISMSIVILSTVPLIIVPFGDLMQQKLGMKNHGNGGKVVRISICIVCASVSILVPNFVYVISFIGCCCVAMTSYTFPALVHICCLLKLRQSRTRILSKVEWRHLYLDGILVPMGLISCILTSSLTFQEMIRSITNSSSS